MYKFEHPVAYSVRILDDGGQALEINFHVLFVASLLSIAIHIHSGIIWG